MVHAPLVIITDIGWGLDDSVGCHLQPSSLPEKNKEIFYWKCLVPCIKNFEVIVPVLLLVRRDLGESRWGSLSLKMERLDDEGEKGRRTGCDTPPSTTTTGRTQGPRTVRSRLPDRRVTVPDPRTITVEENGDLAREGGDVIRLLHPFTYGEPSMGVGRCLFVNTSVRDRGNGEPSPGDYTLTIWPRGSEGTS